jgi:hypothetical protein
MLEMLLMKGLVEGAWRHRAAGKAHAHSIYRVKALPAVRVGFPTARRPPEPFKQNPGHGVAAMAGRTD